MHAVTMQVEAHRDFARSVTVRPNETQALEGRLTALEGTLSVLVRPWGNGSPGGAEAALVACFEARARPRCAGEEVAACAVARVTVDAEAGLEVKCAISAPDVLRSGRDGSKADD